MTQDFFYVSGRGWVTYEQERCRYCSHALEKQVERSATRAEVALLRAVIGDAPGPNGPAQQVSIDLGSAKVTVVR